MFYVTVGPQYRISAVIKSLWGGHTYLLTIEGNLRFGQVPSQVPYRATGWTQCPTALSLIPIQTAIATVATPRLAIPSIFAYWHSA